MLRNTSVASVAPTASPLGSDAAAFAGFRRQIDAAFDEHIPANSPVAILQFPYDRNVGNHMMWLAITDYLRDRRIPIVYAAHGNNFDLDALGRAVGDGPILFLGGVTVSRLWPRHAEVKKAVAERFKRNPLVSLPSTVLFVDDDDRTDASPIFGEHPNVLLMARDPVSAESARNAFPPNVRVIALHDSALRLPAQPRKGVPAHRIVWLARDDMEGAGFVPPKDVHVFDWPELRRHMPAAYLSLRVSGVFSRLRASRVGPVVSHLLNPPITALYRRTSEQILGYGNELLDLGKVLVTDRMHPHMLAALRGQDVVLLPDRFGKNRAVYDYSTHVLSSVKWADTPEQAYELAVSLSRG